MVANETIRPTARFVAGGVGLAAAAYAGYAGVTWLRYGHVPSAGTAAPDPLLDRFMPQYEVVERHHIRVAAPAEFTFAAATEQDLLRPPVIRAIFKARELILGSEPDAQPRPRALLDQVRSLGWGDLAEIPGREIVMGAVTKPWEANVIFRPLPPDEFLRFQEPDHVKIAWTLRADALSAGTSVFRTETRAVATDAEARRKFRRYWAFVSPGVSMIRWMSLAPLKRDAERRFREQRTRAQEAACVRGA